MTAYDATSYLAAQQTVPHFESGSSVAHIYSPTPVSAYSTPFPQVSQTSDEPTSSPTSPQQQPSHALSAASESAPYVIQLSPAPGDLTLDPITVEKSTRTLGKPVDMLEQYDTPQVLFPTPSELLSDVGQKRGDTSTIQTGVGMALASPSSTSDSAAPHSTRRKANTSQPTQKPKTKVLATLGPTKPAKTENLRKSYFRSVADKVGFQSTDP